MVFHIGRNSKEICDNGFFPSCFSGNKGLTASHSELRSITWRGSRTPPRNTEGAGGGRWSDPPTAGSPSPRGCAGSERYPEYGPRGISTSEVTPWDMDAVLAWAATAGLIDEGQTLDFAATFFSALCIKFPGQEPQRRSKHHLGR